MELNKKYKCELCSEELNTHEDIMLLYNKATQAVCFDCLNYDLLEKIFAKEVSNK